MFASLLTVGRINNLNCFEGTNSSPCGYQAGCQPECHTVPHLLVTWRLTCSGTEEGKLLEVRNLAKRGLHPPVLLFVQSKERGQQLYKELALEGGAPVTAGIPVELMHADRTHSQREKIVKAFRLGKIWVLITTELLARGIDFKGVNTVINYDFPQSTSSYIHRVGRTGRAGRLGQAFTLFTEVRPSSSQIDFPFVKSIANVMKQSGTDVPEWILKLKSADRKEKKRLERLPPRRPDIDTRFPVPSPQPPRRGEATPVAAGPEAQNNRSRCGHNQIKNRETRCTRAQ